MAPWNSACATTCGRRSSPCLPQPRPPLILGGSSDGAARRAARIADGFLPTLPQFRLYLVLTPMELVERLKALGGDAALHLHPLMGGLDPQLSWSSLRLFEDEVLPELRAAGLA